MAKMYCCDRCGKKMDSRLLVMRGIEFFTVMDFFKKRYELCRDCYHEIICFIENKEKGVNDD